MEGIDTTKQRSHPAAITIEPVATDAVKELMPWEAAELKRHGITEQWRPKTKQDVEWVLSVIAAAEAEIKTVKSNAEVIVRQQTGTVKFFEGRYGHDLQDYYSNNKPKTRKSIQLLHGSIGYRATGATIDVPESMVPVAMAWAKENLPAAITTPKPELLISELRKGLAISTHQPDPDPETGEARPAEQIVVNGNSGERIGFATVTPERETFWVKGGASEQ